MKVLYIFLRFTYVHVASFPLEPCSCSCSCVSSYWYAEQFLRPLILLLCNIFVLVQYLKRKIHIEIRVNCSRVKVTLTPEQNSFDTAITILVEYLKKLLYCSLRQKVKCQPNCYFLVPSPFLRNIFISLHRRYFLLFTKMHDDARKTLGM